MRAVLLVSALSGLLSTPGLRAAPGAAPGAQPVTEAAPGARPTPEAASGARPAPAPGPRAAARQAPKRWTLAELERLLREKGPGLAAARAKVQAAEAQLLKARLLWVPKARFEMFYSIVPKYSCTVPGAFRDVTLAGGGSLYDAMSTRDMRERYCMGTDNTDTVQDYFRRFDPRNYYFRFELSLGQPLYTFGKIRYAKRLAHRAVSAAELQARRDRDEAVQSLRRAYFGLKLAREMLFVIEEGEEHLRKAERRVRKALEREDKDVDRTDQYRLEIARADVDELTLKVKQGEALALAGLRALLGRAAPRGLDIDPKPLSKVRAEVKPLGHYLGLARQHRPEWRLLDVAVSAAGAQVKLRRAQFLPDLLLLLRYRLNVSTSDDDPRSAYLKDDLHGNSFYVGLTLRWDLDFHFKYADLAKARAELVATTALREQARLGIHLQVERARSQLEDAAKRLEVMGKARKAAQRWLTTMGQRHEVGTAGTKALVDALKAKFQAELRYLDAVNAYNMATVALSRLCGVDVAGQWESK